jgi:hypothetical protein
VVRLGYFRGTKLREFNEDFVQQKGDFIMDFEHSYFHVGSLRDNQKTPSSKGLCFCSYSCTDFSI